MDISSMIKNITEPWGLNISPDALHRMELFADMLTEKNKVMNLTAITEPEKIAALHFADCIFLLTVAEMKGKKIIDVGCGGGFPSMPLLCFDPSFELTGIDSTSKRISFLSECNEALKTKGAFISARAEEYALKNREKYDLALSRAVAPLNVLAELSLPLVKVGGKMLAMKGMGDEEIEEGKNAVKTLGGRISDIKTYSVGKEYPERRVIIIEKISPTPSGYPRRFSKISSKPL